METPVVVQVIATIGLLIGACIQAWATISAARRKEKSESPAAVNPASPLAPPPPPAPAEKPPISATGRSWLWGSIAGFGVMFFLATIAANQQPAPQPIPQPVPQPTPQMGTGCYDDWGNWRCPLVAPAPIGQPCGCPGQGMGVVGP